MKRKTPIINAWKTVVTALEDMGTDNEETTALYAELLESLPETNLVLEEFRDKRSFIQGTIHLYSFEEGQHLSDAQRKNRVLAFRFQANGRAIIDKGWYGKGRIFSGSWVVALEFIISRTYKSALRKNLSEDQRKAFRALIKQLSLDTKTKNNPSIQ